MDMLNRRAWYPILVSLAGLATLAPDRIVVAYTPQSPEVQALLVKAIKVLETEEHPEPGGKALMAMALLKAGVDPAHPKIQQAVAATRQYVGAIRQGGLGDTCYNAAICCLFLIDLDHSQYRTEIETLLSALAARQLANGCWAYNPYSGYDDTSQTQYVVLALWSAHVHGFQIESTRVVAALNWFMRTQDLSGGWTYRAQDPKSTQRVQQLEPSLSMSAAGLGSLYVCGYLLGFANRADQSLPGLPTALRPRAKVSDQKFLSSAGVDIELFKNTSTRGNAWLSSHTVYVMENWTYYAMYSVERCKAFQALYTGQEEKEPKWYNDGVDYLRKTQDSAGGWESLRPEAFRPISTAFAVLFLTRSTAKSIKALEGKLQAGKGLPTDSTDVTINANGKIVDTKETPTIELLLKELEKGDLEVDLSVPDRLQLSQNPAQRAAELERLRRMAMRGPFELRRMAVATLGRDRNMDNVPALIYALSDPDARVALKALDGLRFISRKFDGFEFSETATEAERRAAQSQWGKWYLSIRPDGSLIE